MGGLSRNRMKQYVGEVWRGIEHGSDVDVMSVSTGHVFWSCMRGSYMAAGGASPLNPFPMPCFQLTAGTHQPNGTLRFACLSDLPCLWKIPESVHATGPCGFTTTLWFENCFLEIKSLLLWLLWFMAIFAEVSDNEFDQYCAISGKRCEIGRNKLVLFTNIGSGIRAFDWYQNRLRRNTATLPIN